MGLVVAGAGGRGGWTGWGRERIWRLEWPVRHEPCLATRQVSVHAMRVRGKRGGAEVDGSLEPIGQLRDMFTTHCHVPIGKCDRARRLNAGQRRPFVWDMKEMGAYGCLVWRYGACFGRDMSRAKAMGQPMMRVADMSHARAAGRWRARGRTGCHACVSRGCSSDGVVMARRSPRVGLTHMVANNAASQLSHVVVWANIADISVAHGSMVRR